MVATTDVVEACKDVSIAVMLGGYPRKDYIKEGYVVYKRTLSEITKIMWDSDNKVRKKRTLNNSIVSLTLLYVL